MERKKSLLVPVEKKRKCPPPPPSEKGAIGGHAVKMKTPSTLPQGETVAVINELIGAMTQVFKQSLDKPSRGDSISQKPYLLGQNFKVWLSH